MDKKNMTMKDSCVISLFAAFGVYVKETNHKKAELDQILTENVEKNLSMAIKNRIAQTDDTTSDDSGNVLQSDTQTRNV